MTLTIEQQKLVEENLGLVGKVIKDKVHGLDTMYFYTYDDLFQIGCIGLSKAAMKDKGGCFSTFDYRLIWNEIFDALAYATKRAATTDLPGSHILFQFCRNRKYRHKFCVIRCNKQLKSFNKQINSKRD